MVRKVKCISAEMWTGVEELDWDDRGGAVWTEKRKCARRNREDKSGQVQMPRKEWEATMGGFQSILSPCSVGLNTGVFSVTDQSLWGQNHIPCACLKNLKKRTHTYRTGSPRQLMAASQVQRIYKGSVPARQGKGMGRGGRKGELRRTAQLQSNSQSQPVWRALWKRTVLHVNFCFGEKNDAFLLCREEVPFSHWQTLSLCIQQSLGRAMIQEGMG